MFQNAMEFWSQHILLANANHAAGGFGLAIVLQRYLGGKESKPFLPVIVGWILLAFCLVTHIYAFTR